MGRPDALHRRRVALAFLPLCILGGCASRPASAVAGDASRGGAPDSSTATRNTPFLAFDASVPTCASPTIARVVDAGASPDRDCGTGPPVSFKNDIEPLLYAHCTGEVCHESSWAGSASEYQDLVGTPTPECCDGRKRVDPVHPDQSYVLEKLRGVDLCAGKRMPLSGSVTAQQIAQIARWICQGAPNN